LVGGLVRGLQELVTGFKGFGLFSPRIHPKERNTHLKGFRCCVSLASILKKRTHRVLLIFYCIHSKPRNTPRGLYCFSFRIHSKQSKGTHPEGFIVFLSYSFQAKEYTQRVLLLCSPRFHPKQRNTRSLEKHGAFPQRQLCVCTAGRS
jgi:hypothetical protein